MLVHVLIILFYWLLVGYEGARRYAMLYGDPCEVNELSTAVTYSKIWALLYDLSSHV